MKEKDIKDVERRETKAEEHIDEKKSEIKTL